jgi:hypothetical protein
MDEVWTYDGTNVTKFATSYNFVCQLCLQCMISVCETYELWMNEFCMISITKYWNVKFVMKNKNTTKNKK